MLTEAAAAADRCCARFAPSPLSHQIAAARAGGRFTAWFVDRHGVTRWRKDAPNGVTTVGANFAIDTYLAGSSYSVTGPYVGLISSLGYSAILAGDTMAAHPGWLEAGNANAPTYSGTRGTPTWSAAVARAKSFSAALPFTITALSGTIKGMFLVFGPGAVATIDDPGGILYSAGLFTDGDQTVSPGTLFVIYKATL